MATRAGSKRNADLVIAEAFADIQLPTTAEARAMPWSKLHKIRVDILARLQKIEDTLRDRVFIDLPQPKAAAILKIANKRAMQEVVASAALKKAALSFKNAYLRGGIFGSGVRATVPPDLARKFILKIMQNAPLADPFRYTVTFAANGKVKNIVIDDADDEQFWELAVEHYARTRSGDGPQISATLFLPGSRMAGRGDTVYVVEKFKNSVRWAKVAE